MDNSRLLERIRLSQRFCYNHRSYWYGSRLLKSIFILQCQRDSPYDIGQKIKKIQDEKAYSVTFSDSHGYSTL